VSMMSFWKSYMLSVLFMLHSSSAPTLVSREGWRNLIGMMFRSISMKQRAAAVEETSILQDLTAFHGVDPPGAHLVDGRPDTLRVDAAAGILDEADLHAGQHVERIECGELDAVVGRQPADVEFSDLLRPQIFGQARDRRLVVVAEGGIAVDRRIFTLLLDVVDVVDIEVG